MIRKFPASCRVALSAFIFSAGMGLAAAWPEQAWARAAESAPQGEVTDDVTATLREFRDKFGPLLEISGISPEAFDRQVGPLVRAAIPPPPPSGDWGFSLGFNVDTSVYDTPPETGRLSVAADATACASVYPGSRPVVRHRTISRDGLTGHVCAFFGSDAAEAGAVLSTAVYVEGPDRHATLRFASAGTADKNVEASERMMRSVVDANLALIDALADLVMDALAKQEKNQDGNAVLIQQTLQALASSLKAPPPSLDRAELDRRLTAAVPRRPDGDDRTWGSSVDFKVDYALGDSARRPDLAGHRLLDDARGCRIEGREATIVHFRRWSRDGLSGHVCGLTTVEDDIWMLAVTAFAEGDGRRLLTTYVGGLAIDGQPTATLELGRERLQAQVALAEWATDQAVDILNAAPAD